MDPTPDPILPSDSFYRGPALESLPDSLQEKVRRIGESMGHSARETGMRAGPLEIQVLVHGTPEELKGYDEFFVVSEDLLVEAVLNFPEDRCYMIMLGDGPRSYFMDALRIFGVKTQWVDSPDFGHFEYPDMQELSKDGPIARTFVNSEDYPGEYSFIARLGQQTRSD